MLNSNMHHRSNLDGHLYDGICCAALAPAVCGTIAGWRGELGLPAGRDQSPCSGTRGPQGSPAVLFVLRIPSTCFMQQCADSPPCCFKLLYCTTEPISTKLSASRSQQSCTATLRWSLPIAMLVPLDCCCSINEVPIEAAPELTVRARAGCWYP